jgi:hypothetical protein
MPRSSRSPAQAERLQEINQQLNNRCVLNDTKRTIVAFSHFHSPSLIKPGIGPVVFEQGVTGQSKAKPCQCNSTAKLLNMMLN